jgi:hypothetical protein
MIKRTLTGVLLCSILLCGCGKEAVSEDVIAEAAATSETVQVVVNTDNEQEDVNTDNAQEGLSIDDEKAGTEAVTVDENKDAATEGSTEQASVDYSSIVPLSVSNPQEYAKLTDELHALNEKLTTMDFNTIEYRETKWAINDLNEKIYGGIAGKLIGSDISMEDFGGTIIEYNTATNPTFADDYVHGEEFSSELEEGDTVMVFGTLPFKVERVYHNDKFDPERVTSYQLSYEHNYEKKLETNLSGILGKYTSAGFEYEGQKYEVVWHEGRENVKTNLDTIIDGAYSLNSSHKSLGANVPTIYRRISVGDYVELQNLQVGQNWYFGDWKVDKNGELYELKESTGMFNIDDISTGHCTITLDSEDRYLDHAVLDISWMDQQGNTITYVYHLDAGWNAYKLGTYPQSIKFNYG